MAAITATLIPYSLVDGKVINFSGFNTQLVLECHHYLLIDGAMSGQGASLKPKVVGKLSEVHGKMCCKGSYPYADELEVQTLTIEDHVYASQVNLAVEGSIPPSTPCEMIINLLCDSADGESEDDEDPDTIEAVVELNPAQAAVKQIFDDAMSQFFSSSPAYTTREYVDTILDNLRRRYNNGEF